MQVDFLGNELNIGDEVVFMRVEYRNLMRGVIKSMGTVKGTIEHTPDYRNRSTTMQFFNQMVKIPPVQR